MYGGVDVMTPGLQEPVTRRSPPTRPRGDERSIAFPQSVVFVHRAGSATMHVVAAGIAVFTRMCVALLAGQASLG